MVLALLLCLPSASASVLFRVGPTVASFDGNPFGGLSIGAGWRITKERWTLDLTARGAASARLLNTKLYIDPHDAWLEYARELSGGAEFAALFSPRVDGWFKIGGALGVHLSTFKVSCFGDFCDDQTRPQQAWSTWAGAGPRGEARVTDRLAFGTDLQLRIHDMQESEDWYPTLTKRPGVSPQIMLYVSVEI